MDDEEINDNEYVRNLLIGTVPERKDEIDNLLKKLQFICVDDRPGFFMENGFGVTLYTERTIHQIYIVSLLAWRAIQECSGDISCLIKEQNNSIMTQNKSEQEDLINKVDALADILSSLKDIEYLRDFIWPDNVPKFNNTSHDNEDIAQKELACFALAFVFLHEIKHALFRLEGREYFKIDEEYACDIYSIDFLINKVDEYAKDKIQKKPDQILSKRTIGLLIGLFIVMEITQFAKYWEEGHNHPPAPERLQQFLSRITLVNDNDNMWLVASSLLLSKLRREGHSPSGIKADTFRQACDNLVLSLITSSSLTETN